MHNVILLDKETEVENVKQKAVVSDFRGGRLREVIPLKRRATFSSSQGGLLQSFNCIINALVEHQHLCVFLQIEIMY